MEIAKTRAILDVLQLALKKETDAYNDYLKASQKAAMPETVSLLKQLADEELKHQVFVNREIQRIQNLTDVETQDVIEDEHVRFSLPDPVEFKRLVGIAGVDLAAVSLPTEFLGGDFVDAVQLEGSHPGQALGLVITDVMGHGIGATHLKAEAGSVFRHLVQMYSEGDHASDLTSPAGVMAILNTRLTELCQASRRFMTAFYGVIDPARGIMRYVSAGHEPPLLIRQNGDYCHLDETGLLIGAMADVDYRDVVVPIASGDVIALFSDGITEACNSQGVMFGRKRLKHVVQKHTDQMAAEIVLRIVEAIRAYIGDEPVTDEFTLAVVKILSNDGHKNQTV